MSDAARDAHTLFVPLERRAEVAPAATVRALRDAWVRAADPWFRAFSEWRPSPAPADDPDGDDVAVTYKDVIDVEGWTTRYGLRDFRRHAERSAAVAALLSRSTWCAGKVETTELSLGNWAPCRNPWYPAFSPGGSSTGSAVAVAAGFCDLSVGTDAYASVRWPATHCGVVALRLTPREELLEGVLPVCPSMEAIGVIARTAADLRHAWSDPLRPLHPAGSDGAATRGTPALAQATNWRAEPCAPAIVVAWDRFVARLEASGVALPAIELGWWGSRRHVWALLLPEARAAILDAARREGFEPGESVRRALQQADGLSDDDYAAAVAAQADAVVRADMELASSGADVVVLPLDPAPPRRVDTPPFEQVVPRADGRRVTDVAFASVASFARLPSVALPVGTTRDGVPLAVQLVARRGHEQALVDAAALVERAVSERGEHPAAARGGGPWRSR